MDDEVSVMTKALEKEGRKLGEKWLGEVGCSDKRLAEYFVDVLVKQWTVRSISFQFSKEGLTFIGDHIDAAVSMMAMLETVLQQVRMSHRFTSMKSDKSKEKLLARVTGAFWLPLMSAVASVGTLKMGVTYALTLKSLEAYKLSVGKPDGPQKVMVKHFHTPRESKWSDTATVKNSAFPTVCLCLGERTEGKSQQLSAAQIKKNREKQVLMERIKAAVDALDATEEVLDEVIDIKDRFARHVKRVTVENQAFKAENQAFKAENQALKAENQALKAENQALGQE